MAVLVSFSSRPSTKRQQALLALPKIEVALKRLSSGASTEEVLAAVQELLSKELGAEIAPVQKKAKKAAKASE